MSPASYIEEAARRVAEAAPPLTAEQRTRLAALLGAPVGCSPVTPGARPKPLPEPKVALYRHWDEDGVLLYVGISVDPAIRRRSHVRHSVWTEFAARETIEWLPNRLAAEAAEKAAIRNEKPLFNGTHTTPEAQRACVEYLIGHGRHDLLRFGGRDG